MPVTFLLVDKNTKCGYSFSKLDRQEYFGNELSRSADIFTFSTLGPIVSALADIAHYQTSSLI